jgi:hypothetical protein
MFFLNVLVKSVMYYGTEGVVRKAKTKLVVLTSDVRVLVVDILERSPLQDWRLYSYPLVSQT